MTEEQQLTIDGGEVPVSTTVPKPNGNGDKKEELRDNGVDFDEFDLEKAAPKAPAKTVAKVAPKAAPKVAPKTVQDPYPAPIASSKSEDFPETTSTNLRLPTKVSDVLEYLDEAVNESFANRAEEGPEEEEDDVSDTAFIDEAFVKTPQEPTIPSGRVEQYNQSKDRLSSLQAPIKQDHVLLENPWEEMKMGSTSEAQSDLSMYLVLFQKAYDTIRADQFSSKAEKDRAIAKAKRHSMSLQEALLAGRKTNFQ